MNPKPLVGLNHFTVPLAIASSPQDQKTKKRTAGPRKPARPTGARYAVWGALDSLKEGAFLAKNDHYRGPFEAFGKFRDDFGVWTSKKAGQLDRRL